MKTPLKIGLAATAGLALAIATPLAAHAHVTVTPSGTGAGSYSVLTFAIPHGCDGSATTAIRITIPNGVESVTPTVNPNWDVAMLREGDRVATVTYTAHDALPGELRDTFELSVRLPTGAAGDVLAFPVLQSCVEGSVDWAQVAAGAGEATPELPAPSITLTESTGGHGHDAETGHEQGTEHDTATVTATASGSTDVLARGFGIGGLVVGAVGIVLAVAASRRATGSDSTRGTAK
ncbi:MAG: YcnI family protein [Cryobacterium sp.]|nr:YcnI family protein [Cryobacterium sp.]